MYANDESPPIGFVCFRESIAVRDHWGAVFPSELGWMACLWRGQRLAWNSFGIDSEPSARAALRAFARSEHPSAIDVFGSEAALNECPRPLRELARRLACFACDFDDRFLDLPLDLDHLGPFTRRVIDACRAVAPGRTVSYADLAVQAGSPGAARAVGNAMARNRFPLIVPCHRVVGAKGHLGGYSAPQGLAMKRRLLAAESENDAARLQRNRAADRQTTQAERFASDRLGSL
jgi:methylated-DNA-[protein]-cysteine S-methyltransferase